VGVCFKALLLLSISYPLSLGYCYSYAYGGLTFGQLFYVGQARTFAKLD